jgi:hypothetical protein
MKNITWHAKMMANTKREARIYNQQIFKNFDQHIEE